MTQQFALNPDSCVEGLCVIQFPPSASAQTHWAGWLERVQLAGEPKWSRSEHSFSCPFSYAIVNV